MDLLGHVARPACALEREYTGSGCGHTDTDVSALRAPDVAHCSVVVLLQLDPPKKELKKEAKN